MKLRIFAASMLTIAATMAANAQLLWKVTPPSGAPVSYLFGTHHLAPLAVLDSVAGFNEALASVDKVYGEIDMSTLNQPESMAKIQQAMTAPADSTLDRLLTPLQLDSVNTVVRKFIGEAADVAMFTKSKPAAVASLLTVFAASKIPGINPLQHIDQEIQRRAAAAGKAIGGLETLEFQSSVLYGTPLAAQTRDLMRTVREILDGHAVVDMYTAYRAGRLDEMMTSDGTSRLTDEEAETLIYSRNNAWIEFLLGALPTASIMIAVGGGHLPGERGLIEQLRNHGYIVEPSIKPE